ncbi:hypothetical protein PPQ05_001055 [Salmonella enterica]|uniref:Uncharacterized protein n=1 Tax=Salmonella enterica TaxID=28901 RepID=A0A624U0P9_SALER|nr:hypothetical protein [Salmonella enterica]ECV4081702.1 hypothetical protein [Salmonella enterica subsp. enterica serovar Sandiego]EAM1776505.1 hypothetical protein [Salmonella enterica]EAO0724290.1 hypothetical protein [Salmonella enterica]EAO4343128.1 hypothetical protein [Salmonella enterica]EAO9217859.1 hypothetical protein [Salmonella enterica]
MSKTLTPTITITISGPTGSGKSSVLARIADALRLWYDDEVIIDSLALKAEKEMCGNDYTAWHKPRSCTIFKLEEVNLPGSLQKPSIRDMSYSKVMALLEEYGCRDKVGPPLTVNLDPRELLPLTLRYQGKSDREITVDNLVDRPVPVHIQALMSKLGISLEEYQETDLQPVVDLVNWALATPKIPESTPQPDMKNGAQATSADKESVIRDILRCYCCSGLPKKAASTPSETH